MLDWIKNSPQSIYALLGDYGMGKTFSCRILSAKLTEEEEGIKQILKMMAATRQNYFNF
jgi:type II secretory pathway predicted ATPase ExeA